MLLIDAIVPVAEVDLKLARAVLDEYKPVLIAINKWDLAKTRPPPASSRITSPRLSPGCATPRSFL